LRSALVVQRGGERIYPFNSQMAKVQLDGVLGSSARKRGAKPSWLGPEYSSLGPSSAPPYLPPRSADAVLQSTKCSVVPTALGQEYDALLCHSSAPSTNAQEEVRQMELLGTGPTFYGIETAHHGPDAGTAGKADECFVVFDDMPLTSLPDANPGIN
jgi:hypothetical protein